MSSGLVLILCRDGRGTKGGITGFFEGPPLSCLIPPTLDSLLTAEFRITVFTLWAGTTPFCPQPLFDETTYDEPSPGPVTSFFNVLLAIIVFAPPLDGHVRRWPRQRLRERPPGGRSLVKHPHQ